MFEFYSEMLRVGYRPKSRFVQMLTFSVTNGDDSNVTPFNLAFPGILLEEVNTTKNSYVFSFVENATVSQQQPLMKSRRRQLALLIGATRPS